MVYIEQGTLRTLEQNLLPFAQRIVEQLSGFRHMRTNDLGIRQVRFADFFNREGALAVHFFKNGVLGFQSRFNFHAENVLVKKILDADAAAGGLILIARADAAVRCADFVFPETELRSFVQLDVIGHDDVGIARDFQAIAGKAFALQHLHLFNQDLRVHHDAVADNRNGVFIHDARRNQMQGKFLFSVDDRMAGVIAALIANHVVEISGNKIGDLALALVAPLGADQHHVRHVRPFT